MLWTAHFWEVEKVHIQGATANTLAYVENFVQRRQIQGQHVLALNPLELKSALETNPLLKNVALEREILPATVTLKVQERQPRYVLLNTFAKRLTDAKTTVIDAEGMVLPLASSQLDYTGPVIYLDPKRYQKGQIPAEHLNLIHELNELYARKALTDVGVFDISNPQNVMFYLEKPALKIWLGRPEELVVKMRLIESTYQAAEVKEADVDYIDLRFWNHPVVKTGP